MIKSIVKIFIGYKAFQLILSIALLLIAYKIYPQPFHFILQILSNIK